MTGRLWAAVVVLAAIAAAAGWGLGAPSGSGEAEARPAAAQQRLHIPRPKQGRARPLVAIIADNAGTETTDFVIPFGVLRQADVAEVVTVSTGPGAVRLMPALSVRADRTLAAFDAAEPAGADIVIVPAMHRRDSPEVTAWIRAQAEKGAVVVGICEGAFLLAHAGILEGRQATTHWYARGTVARSFPATAWLAGRRYVVDGPVMTTAGVTASIPASLALVEAIAGPAVARTTAERLGVERWGPDHSAEAFRLTAGHVMTAAVNWLLPWRHETVALTAGPGSDEVALALAADAWSRTFRSQAVAAAPEGFRSRRGLWFEPEAVPPGALTQAIAETRPARSLDGSLAAIAARYGRPTAAFAALQLEYPGGL